MRGVTVKDLTVVYEDQTGRPTQALDQVTLDVPPGQFVVCVGPSGCGKTTLLKVVAGLLPPTRGAVLIDDQPVIGPGEDRAMVFQEYALLPWRDVRANIRFGLELRKQHPIPRKEWEERIARVVDLVGLRGFERHFPHQLSGGMRQRVGIARGLVLRPNILLMDEPFAALDAITREVMQSELLRILAETQATVIFITHSIDEAIILGDRIAMMSRRPGRLLEIVSNPLPKPRWRDDLKTMKEYVDLREELWIKLRTTSQSAS